MISYFDWTISSIFSQSNFIFWSKSSSFAIIFFASSCSSVSSPCSSFCILYISSCFPLNIKPNDLISIKIMNQCQKIKKNIWCYKFISFLHSTKYIQFYEWACSQNYIGPVNHNMQKIFTLNIIRIMLNRIEFYIYFLLSFKVKNEFWKRIL